MTTHDRERRALQIALAVLALVPIGAGLAGAIGGLSPFAHGPAALDSHYRYLSGILLAVGVFYLRLVPHIERNGTPMRQLTALVCAGGLVRLAAYVREPSPDLVTLFALVMELVVVPLLAAWQARVGRHARLVRDTGDGVAIQA